MLIDNQKTIALSTSLATPLLKAGLEGGHCLKKGLQCFVQDLVIYFKFIVLFGGSEFSSYEIELRKSVMQSDVTLQVTNSKIFIEGLLSSYELDFIKY